MKRLIGILILLQVVIACDRNKSFSHVGSWKMISMEYVDDERKINFPGQIRGSDMKIWSENQFAFVGKYEMDTGVVNSYGGGHYKLAGNRYTEEILYHTNPDFVGMKIQMLLEVRNDTLIQTWPINENGEVNQNHYRIEKYIRF